MANPTIPMLVLKDDAFLCTACGLCEKVCPSSCLSVVPVSRDPHPLERELHSFSLGLYQCIQCHLCQDVCPENAIEMSWPKKETPPKKDTLGKEDLALRP